MSPWVYCRQNFVMAYKMLRPRAQMALENACSFQYLMYKFVLEKTNLAWKYFRGPQFITRPKWPLKCLAYLDPGGATQV